MPNDRIVAETASRHNLSPSAVRALADSLARGGGGSAQWSHPDLGGMGQWFSGGMIQIGDMFNNDLKARVAAALDDLVGAGTAERADGSTPLGSSADWWPRGLGRPSSTGSQNDLHYACFPEAHRLAVKQGGRVTLYDTGSRRLTGFAQAQGSDQSMTFSGPDGTVRLEDLAVVA